MPELVTATYHEIAVSFTEDAWFNATTVAERFGKRPNDWLSLDSTKEYITALASILNVPEKALLKTKRGGNNKTNTRNSGNGGTWFHPKLGIPFARWLDVTFGVWCDDQIYKILTGTHQHYDWKKLRHEATASYKVMNQILQMTRERLGKTCSAHHFSNEARLINWALTKQFGKLDREALSPGDLDLLAKLENLDSVLLGCNATYEYRKKELERFASEQRAPGAHLGNPKNLQGEDHGRRIHTRNNSIPYGACPAHHPGTRENDRA